MTTYSIGGYLALLAFRTSKTILVEGPSDKRAISALLQQLKEAGLFPRKELLIDTAAMIQATGLGKREIVEKLHSDSHAAGTPIAALCDREFRGFQPMPTASDQFGGHKEIPPSLFWTRGHSIENYFFTEEYYTQYLTFAHPEALNDKAFELVRLHFDDILCWAARIGLAAHVNQLISKLNGVFSRTTWKLATSGGVEPDLSAIKQELISRGVATNTADSFEKEVISQRSNTALTPGAPLVRWINHGHIGFSATWTAIGRLVEAAGVSIDTAETVARGEQIIKERYLSERWAAKASAGKDEHPDRFVRFISAF